MAPARQALSARADFSCDYRGHCHRQFTTTQQPCRLQARIEAPTRTARTRRAAAEAPPPVNFLQRGLSARSPFWPPALIQP